MGEYLSAGLYPEERSASAGPVGAVSTSNYATAGWLRKGPVNQAELVTGFDNFIEKFGTYWRNSYVPNAIKNFFDNDGARAFVVRVVPSDATKAVNASCLDSAEAPAVFYTRKLVDPLTTLDATHFNIGLDINGGGAADVDVTGDSGVAGSYALAALAGILDAVADIDAAVEAVLGGGDRVKISTTDPGVAKTLAFSAATANDCSKEFLGLDTSATTYTYTGEAAIDWSLEAAWQGSYYNQDRICISGNADDAKATGGWNSFNAEVQEESAVGAGDWATKETYDAVVFDDDTDDQFVSTVMNDQTNILKITAGTDYGTPRDLTPYQRQNECVGEGDAAEVSFSGVLLFPVVAEDTLSIVAGAIEAEDDGEGTLSGAGITSGTINYTTGAWTLVFDAAPASGELIMASYWQDPAETEVCCQLSGGTDGTGPLTRNDVSEGSLEAGKEGLYALNDVEEVLNVSLPDFAGVLTVANDLITYAEGRADRFVILSTTSGLTPANAVKYVRKTGQFNTSYAAIYYPWVTIADPQTVDSRPVNIPPDGFIAGVYARTDINRNVGKAPAGINDGKINGAIGLERVLDKGERDLLYPARVNPLMSSAQTGRAVWGARTLSLDAEWRYINARRLFIFGEKSIENASYWTVFENNGPGLWGKMLTQGNAFFTILFRDGYFAGNTPAEAFKIVIDETNNPQENIDAGLVTADYYMAPNKPGEFIRLRFQQYVKPAA